MGEAAAGDQTQVLPDLLQQALLVHLPQVHLHLVHQAYQAHLVLGHLLQVPLGHLHQKVDHCDPPSFNQNAMSKLKPHKQSVQPLNRQTLEFLLNPD